ncbi:MAG: DUF4175 family protein [Deltaproteobacteria bacterium]|nr:DUF4175 family protein [Deltaproteobacteria bacterium]
MGQEEYRELSSFLQKFVLRVRVLKGMEGLFLIGVCALVLFPLGLGIQYIKEAFPYAPLSYSVLTAVSAVILLGWTFSECLKKRPKEWSARFIEEKHPQLRNNLINSLQLYPQVADAAKLGISSSMVLALLRVTRSQLQKIQIKDLISKDRIKAEARLFGLLLVPVLALVLFNPSSVGETFSLLVHPLRDLPPSETFIDVNPKGTRMVRGSSVRIEATASGAIPKSMDLILSTEESKDQTEKLYMDNLGEGKFAATIQDVQKSLQYRVAVGPFSSPWYAIEAVESPAIGNIKPTLYPPHYTGLPMQTLDGGNIEGIKGSTIRLEARSNKELAKAKIILDQGREIPLKIQGKKLQGSLVLLQSQRYQILVEDSLGFRNAPISYELRVKPDAFPSVELLRPSEDLEVNGDESLVVEFSAKDDFGIQDVFLVTKVRDKEERIRIRKDVNSKVARRERYLWDVGRLKLQEGDEVLYYLEVLDNDTISGPKVGSSRALKLRLKDLKAEHKQVAEMIHDLSNQMLDLLADHLERGVPGENEPLQQADNKDKAIEQKAGELMERIEELMERTEIDRLSNFATWSDLQSLKRNLQFTKDELLQKRAQAVSPQDRERLDDEISSELERMSLLAEDMTKRLTAQEVSRTAQDLLRSQERLMESMGNLQSGNKELDAVLKELSRLAKQLGELQQSLSKFASRLPQEFMNSDSIQGLDFRNMMSGLNEIRKKLMEGDIEGAMRLARELFNQMASMVAALRNAHQSAMSSTMGRMQGEMMRSASELQRIVREQQEILEQTEGTHKKTLERREALLKEKLEQFQAKAQEEAARLAKLFPNQESHNEEGASADELDEVTMNNLANNLTVKLQEKDLEMLSRIMKLARQELGKKRRAEQEEKARSAEALIEGLTKDLEALLEEPVVELMPGQKAALADLSQQEGDLQERTANLHDKFSPLFQLFPSLDPKILKNIREASVSMEEAENQLAGLNAKEAIPPEQTALDRLLDSSQQMQSSMQQLAQRGQLGRMPVVYLFRRGRFLPGGRLVPLPGVPKFPDFDAEGGLSGLDTEKFQLPGKEDYRVPRRYREEILESLKQGVPDQFKDQIENYFKDLSQ